MQDFYRNGRICGACKRMWISEMNDALLPFFVQDNREEYVLVEVEVLSLQFARLIGFASHTVQ